MSDKILMPQLVSMLASATGKPKKEAEKFLKGLFAIITDALVDHETVKIASLGTFKVSRVEPRRSVDVTSGAEMEIPAHYKIVFTPSRQMAEKVNRDFAWLEPVEVAENLSAVDFENIDGDVSVPMIWDRNEEEESEHLGEEIEKEFGEIEPVEPFGPVDPDDPEPGEPIPEDNAQDSEIENEGFLPMVNLATKKDIRRVDRHIYQLGGKVDRNEKKNKRRFRAVFFWSLLLALIILVAIAGLYYFDCVNLTREQGVVARELTTGSQAANRGEPAVNAESATAGDNMPRVEQMPGDSEAETAEDVAPTAPSDRPEEPKNENRKGPRVDTITKTRFLTTMAREYYGNMVFWPYIYIENGSRLGHPDRIKPGTEVVIPDLSKYGVNPRMQKDIDEAKMLGNQIYAGFR